MTAFLRIGNLVIAAGNIAGVEIHEIENAAPAATLYLKSPIGKAHHISLAPSQTALLIPWLSDGANVLDLGLMTQEEYQAFALDYSGGASGGSKSRFGRGDIPGPKS